MFPVMEWPGDPCSFVKNFVFSIEFGGLEIVGLPWWMESDILFLGVRFRSKMERDVIRSPF